ncbi:GNAT family N-acetyltransferase [Chloroflexota bacterium]
MQIDIREATQDDNRELQKVQTRCPQGSSQNLSTVNTPDFFTRVKIFGDHKVYVATRKNRIIGSTACAVHDALVNGKVAKIGYGFQAFVDPKYRGKGVAGLLHKVREDYMRERGAVLGYTLVLEQNIASMRYIERQGFKQHRTLVMPSIMVNQEMDVGSDVKIRPITQEDLAAVASLVNETWQDYELYDPMTADSLASLVRRTPVYSFDDIFVLEENKQIMACLGFWDWSRVMRITVRALSLKVRAMSFLLDIVRIFRPIPKGPKIGDELKQIVLTPIGFRDIEHLTILLRHINNQAFAKGIHQIDCACEKNHPLLDSLNGFIRIDSGIHIYIKPFQDDVVLADRPFFIDGLDL